MAGVVIVYGPVGTGKTTSAVRLGELLRARGRRVGGFFQRARTDDLERRSYDLVRFAQRSAVVELARPGNLPKATQSTVCSFVFSPAALAAGRAWLEEDAAWADVLLIDEVSKLEVAGDGHCEAVRWALSLPADRLVVLSIRADQLTYAVEKFDLADRIRGYIELPASDAQLHDLAQLLSSRR